MPALVLFDLDNTLLDRQAAFALWASSFIATYGLPVGALAIIEELDADGFRVKDDFFGLVRDEFDIPDSVDDLVVDYNLEYPACYSIDVETVEAVRSLRSNGWKVGVVTNGSPSQYAKFEATNIVEEFDAICISAVLGARKPDLAIFEEAARICGVPLEGWMVGDSPSADIAGGKRAGLRTIWMARGREWNLTEEAPDAIVTSISEAVIVILGSDHDT